MGSFMSDPALVCAMYCATSIQLFLLAMGAINTCIMKGYFQPA